MPRILAGLGLVFTLLSSVACWDSDSPSEPTDELRASFSATWVPAGTDPDTGQIRDCQLTLGAQARGGKAPYSFEWLAPWANGQGIAVSTGWPRGASSTITLPANFGQGGLFEVALLVEDADGNEDGASAGFRFDCAAAQGGSFQGR